MRAVATLLAFAASALALQVTQPTNATGWSTSGQNTVAWNAVSTDASNFTVVLVNMNEFPNYSQILDALVDTSLGKVSVNPPSSGWPSGKGFQVNLVADNQHLNTILAQSDQFSFVAPSGSSSGVSSTSSGSASSGSGATMTVSATSQATSGTSSGSNTDSSDDLNPTSSDTATSPSSTNGAIAAGVQATFFGVVALVGAMLA